MTEENNFAKVKRGFCKQNFMATLGADVIKSDPGKCIITLPYNASLTQQHGLFHGGTIATIADNAAAFAAYSLMCGKYQPLTIEFKINFLTTANGAELRSEAEVLKAGKSIFHVQSHIYSISEKNKILIATALVTVKATKAISEL